MQSAVAANMDTRSIIAANLRRLLENGNKSRKDVCSDLDIKYTTFCDWINAKAYPRIESLERVASYFGVQVGDFFIDIESADNSRGERLMAYAMRLQEVDIDFLKNFSDEQIKLLLKSGVRVKKKKLEDYIREAGHTKVIASEELDWGEPVGREIW